MILKSDYDKSLDIIEKSKQKIKASEEDVEFARFDLEHVMKNKTYSGLFISSKSKAVMLYSDEINQDGLSGIEKHNISVEFCKKCIVYPDKSVFEKWSDSNSGFVNEIVENLLSLSGYNRKYGDSSRILVKNE